MTDDIAALRELEKKVLWLASWTIHNANHLRENDDGLKVGGHQASSASLATIMTALYFMAFEIAQELCQYSVRDTETSTSGMSVRRDKAALSSGCKSHPANAPAGSNRSSHGGDEIAEAFG